MKNVMHKIGDQYKRCSRQIVGKSGIPCAVRHTPIESNFTMNINWDGVPQAYKDSEYAGWILDMKNYFEQVITGLRYAPSQKVSLTMNFEFRPLGGPLAQCGPGNGTENPMDFLTALTLDTANNIARPLYSLMAFDTGYFQVNPTTSDRIDWKKNFFNVCVHEAFHGLGLGALWNGNFRIIANVPIIGPTRLPTLFPYNVIGQGNPDNPQYIASQALMAWRETMVGQQSATVIPIENYGRDGSGVFRRMGSTDTIFQTGGTALAHWKETNESGTIGGLNVFDTKGRHIADEIFTGWSNTGSHENDWVGKFTVAALRDIGWEIDYLPLELDLKEYRRIA